jgi:plastocyanin
LNLRRLLAGIVASCFVVVLPLTAGATAPLVQPPAALSVGVDTVDFATQNPAAGRLFEYTDFFTGQTGGTAADRAINVHQGDVVAFTAAPFSFHIVGVAADEAAARRAYPVVLTDTDGSVSKATGLPKLILGPSNFPITAGNATTGGGFIDFSRGNGPPDCGIYELGQSVCTFTGGPDVEVAGPNTGVDWPTLLSTGRFVPAFSSWNIQVNAPVGTYHFFCFIHPGMRGTVNVSTNPRTTITQAAVATQLADDKAGALSAEAAVSPSSFTGGVPGTRTYAVHVGISDADQRVAIDEVLPNKPLSLAPGDKIHYEWRDPHNVHSVVFPIESPLVPSPFGVDCMNRYIGFGMTGLVKNCAAVHLSAFELIADPGNSLTHLSDPTQLVDSGVLIGTDYGVTPTAQDWSVTANSPGTYHFQCTIHDWMRQAVTIS